MSIPVEPFSLLAFGVLQSMIAVDWREFNGELVLWMLEKRPLSDGVGCVFRRRNSANTTGKSRGIRNEERFLNENN